MGCRPSSPEAPIAPPDPPSSRDIPSDPKGKTRPSITSLHIPNYADDVSSDGMSIRSGDAELPDNEEYLCHTDITLSWLLKTLSDKLHKPIDTEPQWITERLNRPSWEEYATSSVIRVTFGWEDEDVGLPKSIVLKLAVSKEMREDEEGKFHYLMFKRECNVYDWTTRYPKLPAPRIYHIKRHSKEGGSGVVVMEDIGDRSVQQDAVKGLSVSIMRDLLKNLALVHATSMKQTSWSTLVADLPPSYYAYSIGNFEQTMNFFEANDVEHSRFVHTGKFFTTEYLHTTATESAEELGVPKVLVHGEPYASNVFVAGTEGKDQRLAGLIDWTECHAGCFAEDLAKAICWNLSSKDRLDNTSSLLEGYHFHLVRYCNGDCPITVDSIRRAYERFMPVAMVTLVAKVMAVHAKSDIEPLIERAKSLIQNVYTIKRLAEKDSV